MTIFGDLIKEVIRERILLKSLFLLTVKNMEGFLELH